MSIGKIALALAALVIVGLVIIAIITIILPAAFAFVSCAVGLILNPSSGASIGTTCVTALTGSIKLN